MGLKEPELKSCDCDNSKPKLIINHDNAYVYCWGCGKTGPEYYNEDDAVKDWNSGQ